MKKIEYIYQIFHSIMVSEVDKFWEGSEVNAAKLEIDYENLNAIAIYAILKSGGALLLIDIIFIENFVSHAILSTNRAFHMTVLLSGLEFIENNINTYFESKEKTNPLKTNMTP